VLRPSNVVWLVVVLGGVLGAVWIGGAVAAGAAEPSAADLLAEARKLYQAHNYEGALKRLQQIDRASLGFFDRGKYDALLKETQKGVAGKAADEKAFAEGKEALAQGRYATAIAKLTQAAKSPYLEADKAGPAEGLLRLARDGHDKALRQARDLLGQARGDLEAGRADAARKKVAQVEAMDLNFAKADRAALADLKNRLAVAAAKPVAPKPPAKPAEAPAEKPAPKPAEKPAAKPAEKPAPKPAEKPAPKPAPKPAEKPAEKPPAKPAEKPAPKPAEKPAPSASDQYAEAKRLYEAGDYEGAKKALARVRKADLGFFEALGFDGFVRDVDRAIAGRQAARKALADGKAALEAGKFATAVACLSEAAASKFLPPKEAQEAADARAKAKAAHAEALAKAKGLIAQAEEALAQGNAVQARRLVDTVAAMDVDLGWWTGMKFRGLQSRVASVKTVAVAEAKPSAVPAAGKKPAEAQPAAKPGPAAKPTPAKPAAEAKPAPKKPAALDLEAQMRRAHAEEQIKLGRQALADYEYEKARIHFARALQLWPDSKEAKQGLDEAKKLLAEREEPLGDLVRDLNSLERQRIIADVQEMIEEATRLMEKAKRPEDYTEALRPLARADRTIDTAAVLTVEEQERLREEVHALRKQITSRRDALQAERERLAAEEARRREAERREADRRDRERKIQQLWQRATELRKSMQFRESIEVLDRLLAIDPTDERARSWREDLLYLESQARQVAARERMRSGAVEALVDVHEAATPLGERVGGEVRYLRYPEAKKWKDLTEFRRAFTQAVSAEPPAVAETRRRLEERIDLDFEKTSLDNVLKYISEVQRGLNIVIDPDIATAGIDLSTRVVDLKVKQVW